MGILTILMSNKSLLIIGILLIIISGMFLYMKVLKSNIETLEIEKSSLTLAVKVSEESVRKLEVAITEQNTAIEKFKLDADKRAAANLVELKKAKALAETYKSRAVTIIERVPAPGLSSCEAANQLINEVIQNAK